jgi:hypothetical protein
MTTFDLHIAAWNAWAPTLDSRVAWDEWFRSTSPLPSAEAKPDASFLPATLRRRCSTVTRAALKAACACVSPEELPFLQSVFASRHGEADTMLSILETLARGELLSPMEFSLSVHNSASGMFSIHSANHKPSTAIAAGSRTIEAALIETHLAVQGRNEGALCVIADSYLPQVFRSRGDHADFCYALALRCLPAPAPTTHTVRISIAEPGDLVEAVSEDNLPESMFRWMFGSNRDFHVRGAHSRWSLSRADSDHSLSDIFREM